MLGSMGHTNHLSQGDSCQANDKSNRLQYLVGKFVKYLEVEEHRLQLWSCLLRRTFCFCSFSVHDVYFYTF
uniref:Uncharacterized protein n=1 Tax=Ciona intestinalis TaxID=7719 RepID=H2XXV3_CIOIN